MNQLTSQPIKFHFAAARNDDAQKAVNALLELYKHYSIENADIVIAIGGDGYLLKALHNAMLLLKPVYGMNLGTVGFLLNPYDAKNLECRVRAAESHTLYPLKMVATQINGAVEAFFGFNEISLFRASKQAAKIRIEIDGRTRLEELSCDGILLASPAGSTAYNLAAHGPIIPLDSNVMALTPISPFRPRRWNGALLDQKAKVTFYINDAKSRPVNAVLDNFEVKNVKKVIATMDRSVALQLLFDPGHTLEDRILNEQFSI